MDIFYKIFKRHHLFSLSIKPITDEKTKITFDETAIRPTKEDFHALQLLLKASHPNVIFDYSDAEKGNLYLSDHSTPTKSHLRVAESDLLRWLKTWL
ncbi:hypothetical protein IJG76_00230 [Candidatus Saccharibacteria bacterium]|nr:hypothetical protein [Candidatus Saccharibacteria bacterium]